MPRFTQNAFREFRVIENYHLGNNSRSEHCIQQKNSSKKRISAQSRGEYGPLMREFAKHFNDEIIIIT